MASHCILIPLFTGTNLQALIDHTRNLKNKSAAEIVLVVSNKAGVFGLERAQKAGINTKVWILILALLASA
jgi:folate-dependent phosphoribosylglycinamide formyltransferase PurN